MGPSGPARKPWNQSAFSCQGGVAASSSSSSSLTLHPLLFYFSRSTLLSLFLSFCHSSPTPLSFLFLCRLPPPPPLNADLEEGVSRVYVTGAGLRGSLWFEASGGRKRTTKRFIVRVDQAARSRSLGAARKVTVVIGGDGRTDRRTDRQMDGHTIEQKF